MQSDATRFHDAFQGTLFQHVSSIISSQNRYTLAYLVIDKKQKGSYKATFRYQIMAKPLNLFIYVADFSSNPEYSLA